MRATSEIVTIFWEDQTPVGILHINGQTNFWRISKANKELINELVGVSQEDKKPI